MMDKLTKRLATIAAMTLLAACTRPADDTAAGNATGTAATKATTIVTVNGKKLDSDLLNVFAQAVTGKPVSEATPEQKDQLVDQLVNMTLAAQSAEKDGEQNSANVKARLELLRMQVLASAANEKFDAANPVSEADIKAEYVAQVAAMPKEYKARHILVETKDIAESLIRDLQAGGDFAKLAGSESKDAGSAKAGGDLGWFTLDRMVKPFSDAVAALEKGQITPQPIQSEFGWHVIQLEDQRSIEAPDFESVKDRVKTIVERKKFQSHLDEIRKAAKIQKS